MVGIRSSLSTVAIPLRVPVPGGHCVKVSERQTIVVPGAAFANINRKAFLIKSSKRSEGGFDEVLVLVLVVLTSSVRAPQLPVISPRCHIPVSAIFVYHDPDRIGVPP